MEIVLWIGFAIFLLFVAGAVFMIFSLFPGVTITIVVLGILIGLLAKFLGIPENSKLSE